MVATLGACRPFTDWESVSDLSYASTRSHAGSRLFRMLLDDPTAEPIASANAGRAPWFQSKPTGPARLRSTLGVSSTTMYPNFKKGVVVGLVAGFVAAVLVFGLCVWASTWPAVTDVSLTWSFRPWWRESNWLFPLAAFFVVGVLFGLLAAFRPDLRSKR